MGSRRQKRTRVNQKSKKKLAKKHIEGRPASAATKGGTSGVQSGKKKFKVRTKFVVLDEDVQNLRKTFGEDYIDERLVEFEQGSEMYYRKLRSLLLKQQAKERMVLKEHVRKLQALRLRTVKGETAKKDRREMGKYIRALQAEQKQKHMQELVRATKKVEEARMNPQAGGGKTGGSGGGREFAMDDGFASELKDTGISVDELQAMFAHLVV